MKLVVSPLIRSSAYVILALVVGGSHWWSLALYVAGHFTGNLGSNLLHDEMDRQGDTRAGVRTLATDSVVSWRVLTGLDTFQFVTGALLVGTGAGAIHILAGVAMSSGAVVSVAVKWRSKDLSVTRWVHWSEIQVIRVVPVTASMDSPIAAVGIGIIVLVPALVRSPYRPGRVRGLVRGGSSEKPGSLQ